MKNTSKTLPLVLSIVLAAANTAFGQSAAVVPVNLPQTMSAAVTLGATGVSIPFNVSGCSALRVELILPVNLAGFTLLDPGGQAVPLPALEFISGNDLRPGTGLPGGIFASGEITNPLSGTWTAASSFPPASVKTVAVLTAFCKSQYTAGIAIERTSFVTGEDVSIGMLVLNGTQPAAGLSPTITIAVKDQPGTDVSRIGLDDGVNSDGQAGDGLYSVDHTFLQAGVYNLRGTVDILVGSGLVRKTASTTVTVTDPALQVTSIVTSNSTGPGGCITGVNVNVNATVLRAGDFVFSAVLRSSNGSTLRASTRVTLAAGNRTASISFPTSDLRTLGVNGPYAVSFVDAYEVRDSLNLAFKKADAATTSAIPLTQLCSAPLEILPGLTTTPTVSNGYISSLSLTFSIVAQTSGSYSISFSLIGSGGQSLGVFNTTRSLVARTVTPVTFAIPSTTFLTADGPYSVVSVLAVGAGASAQSSQVGSTPAYLRWQFKPRINGDLNGDFAVDVADQNLQSSFRNLQALNPGDRRDLNRDGRIDILDLRMIQTLACSAGSCPVVP